MNKLETKPLKAISNNRTVQSGFSVVEVLLAGSLLIIIVTAFIGAVIYGQETTAVAGGISRATFLAEKGMEAVKNIHDESSGNLSDGSFGLAVSNNQWVFSGNSDSIDNFVRQITISTIDDNRKQITSSVTWQETPQRAGNVVLFSYLTNWARTAPPPNVP